MFMEAHIKYPYIHTFLEEFHSPSSQPPISAISI